jgi:hypothetical protein
MRFPENMQVGSVFMFNGEPVRITGKDLNYFDMRFVSAEETASMVLIPLDFDFKNVEIRELTPVEKLLW